MSFRWHATAPQEARMGRCDGIDYVTERYADLQGLRVAPLGVPFVVSAAWRAGWLGGWPSPDDHIARYWFLASLAIAVALSYGIRAHYRGRFGVVRAPRWRTGVLSTVSLWGGVVALAALQGRFGWRLSVPALFVGL